MMDDGRENGVCELAETADSERGGGSPLCVGSETAAEEPIDGYDATEATRDGISAPTSRGTLSEV